MKPKSIFKALPEEDQQHILSLCATHTYDEVLEIIARPRPEGLQLKTSYSALCRFNCSHNSDARKAAIVDQVASSLQFIRQTGSGSLRTGILSLLETRLFEALRAGKPISQLKDDFTVLKDFRKSFLDEEKWRRIAFGRVDKEARAHNELCRQDEHYDFIPLDKHGQPTDIPPLSQHEIDTLNSTDDITPDDIARLDYRIAAFGPDAVEQPALNDGYPKNIIEDRIEAYRKDLRERGLTPVQAAIEARRAKLLGPKPPTVSASKPDLSTKNHQKKPVNPHNPPKSTLKNSPLITPSEG